VKAFIPALVAATALAVTGPANAQAAKYPTKTVHIIVPFAAGGPTDVVARLIALKLSEKLGQQFIIDNVPGAAGNIGMGKGAKSDPDGYTIQFVSSSYTVNPSLYKNPPYKPSDFAPVTKAGATPNLLVVHPSVPAKNFKEFIALVKANPGKYSVASPGIGTTPTLATEKMKRELGLDFVVVPFKGGNPATQSVLAGHTPIGFMALSNATNLVKQGKLRALAVTSAERNQALPDVPTTNELGIKGMESETMQGVLVPAGTPKEVVALLQKEIAAIVSQPDVKAKMLSLGFTPAGISSEEFNKYINDDVAKWKKVIEDAKINKI